MPIDTVSPYDLGEIVIYEAPDGSTAFDVRLQNEALWLNVKQMADLFRCDKSVISRHLRHIFASGELDRDTTGALFAAVQVENPRRVLRPIEYFNLDAILSVGFRVNSRRGMQFRTWAATVLRDHLLKGYSAHDRRLNELRQSLRLVEQVPDRGEVTSDEATALLRVVASYAYALDLLDDYDQQRLVAAPTQTGTAVGIDYVEALEIIEQLRGYFGGSPLFGLELNDSLHSSLNAIMQTSDGRDVYPSREEKAAHLLYFLVKNHSFVDGNKRIAAALFLWFLHKNALLRRADGSKRVADNALVAMTLLVAVSEPVEKRVMIAVLVNLINERG